MTLFVVVAALPWIMSVALRTYAHRTADDRSPYSTVVVVPVLAAVTAFGVVASSAALGSVLCASGNAALIGVGVVVLGWVVWRLASVVAHCRRVVVSARDARPFSASARTNGGTVVVESTEPDAFAVASGGGAVVVTTALVEMLSDTELQTVIEHERGHLRFRHSAWTQMVEIAARLNPLLRPVVGHVRHAAERHADEHAAALHNRRAAMSALARTALLRAHVERNTTALSSTGGDVVRRVRALTEPAPPPQRRPVVVAAVVLIVAFSAMSIALADVVQDVISPEAGEAPTSVFR